MIFVFPAPYWLNSNGLMVFSVKLYPVLKFIPIILAGVLCGAVTDLAAQQIKSNIIKSEGLLLEAEELLSSIRSLKSAFVQSSTTGALASGTLYITRPGKLRIDYKKPETLQIYADGTWVFYIDAELKEISQLPLTATPASFLIRDKFKFSE